MRSTLDPQKIFDEIDPVEAKELLDEIGERNHVMVWKHAATTNRGRTTHRKELVAEGNSGVRACIPALLKMDKMRTLKGKKPMFLDAALKRSGGRLISVTYNLRVNAGIDFAANALGTDGTQPTPANWLALTNNTGGTSATHASSSLPWSSAQGTDAAASTATGEYTAIGVARAVAVYAHTGSATSYTQTKTWTATGAVTSLQLAGMFGGSSKNTQGSNANNILFVENTFTATSLVNNDQLTLTWTINI